MMINKLNGVNPNFTGIKTPKSDIIVDLIKDLPEIIENTAPKAVFIGGGHPDRLPHDCLIIAGVNPRIPLAKFSEITPKEKLQDIYIIDPEYYGRIQSEFVDTPIEFMRDIIDEILSKTKKAFNEFIPKFDVNETPLKPSTKAKSPAAIDSLQLSQEKISRKINMQKGISFKPIKNFQRHKA